MTEKQTANLELWVGHYEAFCRTARELREFEAYEIIDDLTYRMFSFAAADTTESTEPDEDVYRKCFRITFIGDLSAAEKRKFIDAAFPNARPFQFEIENLFGDASDIDEAYYHYYEEYDETARKSKKYKFAIINTRSLSENNQITDIGNLNTDAVVFVISGNMINESEKRYLDKIKFQVDNNFLFFAHPTETRVPQYWHNNKTAIAEKLSLKKDDVKLYGSSESSNIGQYFADKHTQCSHLLAQKIRNYMIQYYERFEKNVEAYLRSVTELDEFNKDIDKIEAETFKEVDRITSLVRKKLDQSFPTEAGYSFDVRAKIKEIGRQLSKDEIEPTDVYQELNERTKDLLRKWAKDMEDIIAKYLRDISHEVSKRLHESGHTYRSSILLNSKIELQAMTAFSESHSFGPGELERIVRSVSSLLFPIVYAISSGGWIGVPVVLVLGVLSYWQNKKAEGRQGKQNSIFEAEKDMRPFNYFVAHAIRIEFDEIIYFSQDALRNIFKEVREAEQKRITIHNACPVIKAITKDTLKKIRGKCQAIESMKIEVVNDVEQK